MVVFLMCPGTCDLIGWELKKKALDVSWHFSVKIAAENRPLPVGLTVRCPPVVEKSAELTDRVFNFDTLKSKL